MKNKAFTLAEVLITLAILGVVAAIAIPNVVKSYKRSVAETKIKKFYSIMTNAVSLAEIQHGRINQNWSSEDFNKNILYSLNYQKSNYEYRTKRPNTDTTLKFNSYNLTSFPYCLKNGICFNFYPRIVNGRIAALGYGSSWANSTDGKMADIVFDLNGPKAPNESGKDIYNFVVYLDYDSESSYIAPKDFSKYIALNDSSTGQPLSQNRLLDTIKTTKKNGCYNNTAGDTWNCFAVLYLNNFKFPKDYPWL